MAAVANQIHSKAQQIGARIGWNPIDAATQPPTGTRERVLNLSAPRTDHRNLGFEDSCLSESTEEAAGCPDFRVTTWALCTDLPASIRRLPN
jgi:hypothetical protein